MITLATQRTTHLIGSGQQVAQALTAGFRLAYLIGAGLAAAAAVVTFTALPRPDAALGGPPAPGARDRRCARGVPRAHGRVRGSHGAPIGAYTTNGAYSFVTEPALHPPQIRKTGSSGPLAGGYIFTANFYT